MLSSAIFIVIFTFFSFPWRFFDNLKRNSVTMSWLNIINFALFSKKFIRRSLLCYISSANFKVIKAYLSKSLLCHMKKRSYLSEKYNSRLCYVFLIKTFEWLYSLLYFFKSVINWSSVILKYLAFLNLLVSCCFLFLFFYAFLKETIF